VLVDDLRASTDKARELGGTVIRDATPIPGMGSFSLIQDPAGAIFGLWETASQQP
jgi:predicted enzyme related to lactoylglutathione lyase